MSALLAGKRVLVTRPKGQAESLVRSLQRLGATASLLPAMRIAPIEDTSVLDAALKSLSSYDWVVFTSVNGVVAIAQRMDMLQVPRSEISALNIAVIGPKTGSACETLFRRPDLIPQSFVSERLAEELGDVSGKRFLLLRADNARPNLRTNLIGKGAWTDEIAAYHALPTGEDIDVEQPMPEYITLTSAESARAVASTLERLGLDWMSRSFLVCIGPITADAVADMGYKVAAVADPYTEEGLINALVGLALLVEQAHV